MALFALLAAALVLDIPINLAIARVGRKLEVALRMAFLQKVPRIADQYFIVACYRTWPNGYTLVYPAIAARTGERWLRSLFSMLFTAGGIVWWRRVCCLGSSPRW